MFDKNIFKEQFRMWSEQFPFASLEEVEKFCKLHIPKGYLSQYSWLMEQSIAWFEWKRENFQKELLKKEFHQQYMN